MAVLTRAEFLNELNKIWGECMSEAKIPFCFYCSPKNGPVIREGGTDEKPRWLCQTCRHAWIHNPDEAYLRQGAPDTTHIRHAMLSPEITEHKVNPANDALKVLVVDQPGPGGANHHYKVILPGDKRPQKTDHTLNLHFQNGAINEVGVNGLTHEVLLAIVAHRLRGFQKGPYACKANACALTHIEEALHWLQQRTLERMRRGVEGTMVI